MSKLPDNKKRVITGIVMFFVLMPFLVLGGIFIYVLAGILAGIGTFEITRMYLNNKEDKTLKILVPVLSILLVLMMMLSDHIFFERTNLMIFFVTIVIEFFTLIIYGLLSKKTTISDSLFLFGVLIYVGVGFSLMAWMRNQIYFDNTNESLKFINPSGLIVFGYIIITTLMCDMGAYVFGCLFGKHKLCPDVSPKKSVEGSILGSLTGCIVGTLFILIMTKVVNQNFIGFTNYQILNILIVAGVSLILTVFSQFGDLIASKLKREYQIKDYGKIFPGHGGVMDRFDSLLITSYIMAIIFLIVDICTNAL